jgi:four helix bundle protein
MNNDDYQKKSRLECKFIYSSFLRVVKLYKYLSVHKKEYVLSKQLLRSGTSIGANIEEAMGVQSKADFTAKLSISYKEARESHYWIRLLRDTDYLTKQESKSLLQDAEELKKILGSIQKTMQQQKRKD